MVSAFFLLQHWAVCFFQHGGGHIVVNKLNNNNKNNNQKTSKKPQISQSPDQISMNLELTRGRHEIYTTSSYKMFGDSVLIYRSCQ